MRAQIIVPADLDDAEVLMQMTLWLVHLNSTQTISHGHMNCPKNLGSCIMDLTTWCRLTCHLLTLCVHTRFQVCMTASTASYITIPLGKRQLVTSTQIHPWVPHEL